MANNDFLSKVSAAADEFEYKNSPEYIRRKKEDKEARQRAIQAEEERKALTYMCDSLKGKLISFASANWYRNEKGARICECVIVIDFFFENIAPDKVNFKRINRKTSVATGDFGKFNMRPPRIQSMDGSKQEYLDGVFPKFLVPSFDFIRNESWWSGYEYSVGNIRINPQENIFIQEAKKILSSGVSITSGPSESSVSKKFDDDCKYKYNCRVTRKINIKIVF